MNKLKVGFAVLLGLVLSLIAFGQNTQANSTVPRLVNFRGTLVDASGQPLTQTGTVNVSFAIYNSQTGGQPVWQETQNVSVDSQGHYTVQLGASQPTGLPADLFSTNESRWLGVQAQGNGSQEQPRVLLVSVPYALKAADAETLGGKPASAFALATPSKSSAESSRMKSGFDPTAAINNGGSNGIANYVSKFDSATTLIDSQIFDNGTTVGVGTSTPSSSYKLDVNGSVKANNLLYSNVENVFTTTDTRDCGIGLAGPYTVNGYFGTMLFSGFDGFFGATSHPCGNAVEGHALSTHGEAWAVYGQVDSDTGSGVVGEANDTTGTGSTFGVQGLIDGPKGVAVLGMQNDGGSYPPVAAGDLIGVEGLVSHANSIASVFDNTAGGKILSGRQNGTENMSINSNGNVTTSGTITANSFSGSGAGLTVVPATVITGSLGANHGGTGVSTFGAGVVLKSTAANTWSAQSLQVSDLPPAANYVFATDHTFPYVQLTGSTNPSFADVTFDTNVKIDGWTHTAGTPDFVAAQAGTYLVHYSAAFYTSPTSPDPASGIEIRAMRTSGGAGAVIADANTAAYDLNPSLTGLSKSFIVDISAGDSLKLQWAELFEGEIACISSSQPTTNPIISITITRVQ